MVGLGYRKDFADKFLSSSTLKPDFIEVAPENWMNVGGYWKEEFCRVLDYYPLYTHGLSLSVGSPDDLDMDFLKRLKSFLKTYKVRLYSEHLSYAKCDNAHLYDLLPIPFTMDAVQHVSKRIRQVQEILEQQIAIEIVSYYTPVAAEMEEIDFVKEVVKQSDCLLLLDVNNIYINAFNHHYDAERFIDQLPHHSIAYIHMAGHTKVSDNLIIDTHGEAIIDPVYELFVYSMQKIQRDIPVLLERDFNIPAMKELAGEIGILKGIKKSVLKEQSHLV